MSPHRRENVDDEVDGRTLGYHADPIPIWGLAPAQPGDTMTVPRARPAVCRPTSVKTCRMTKTRTPKLDSVAMHLIRHSASGPHPHLDRGYRPRAGIRLGTLQICTSKNPAFYFRDTEEDALHLIASSNHPTETRVWPIRHRLPLYRGATTSLQEEVRVASGPSPTQPPPFSPCGRTSEFLRRCRVAC